jgi:hypothetical protein
LEVSLRLIGHVYTLVNSSILLYRL